MSQNSLSRLLRPSFLKIIPEKEKKYAAIVQTKKHIIFALAKESTFFFNFEKSSAKTTHAKIAQLVEYNLAPQIQNPTLARNTKPRAILNIRENSSVGKSTTLPRSGSRVRVPFFALSTEDARVVELVDTQDLKSCGHCGCAGSSPASSTKKGSYQI